VIDGSETSNASSHGHVTPIANLLNSKLKSDAIMNLYVSDCFSPVPSQKKAKLLPKFGDRATVGIREQRFGGIFCGFLDDRTFSMSIAALEKSVLIRNYTWCAGRDLNPEPVD
jgi:hypothetical protein